MQELIHAKYYNIIEIGKERYFVQNRSQTKTSGTTFPKVLSIGKGLDPDLWPLIQVIKPLSTLIWWHVPTE